jgi:PAS domain S-box-containing protein
MVLVADLLAPVGVIVWLLYFIPILIASRLPRSRAAIEMAVVCVLLLFLAPFVSSKSVVAPWIWMTNHVVGAITLLSEGAVLWRLEERRRTAKGSPAVLDFIIRGTNIGLWDWDLLTNKVWYSAEWKRQIGYEEHEIANEFAEWETRVHPDDLPRVMARVGAYVADPKGDFEVEFRFHHKDGSYRWILARGVVHRDREGKPARMLGTHQDITERKAAEEAQARAAEMAERVSDAFVALDRSWHYTYVNRRAAELLGRRPEDLLGKHIWTEFPEGVGQPFHQAYERALATQEPQYFEDYYAPWDRWFENRVYPSPDGVSIFFHEVTDRKRAEAARREVEDRLRLFVHYAPSAIAMFDRDMRYLAYSHRWLTDYGLGERDLTGLSHYDVFPDLPDRWKEVHRRCLAGAVEKCEEDPFPRADGSVDWVRWEVHPWHTGSGEVGGIIVFSEVITDRKRAEAALRESEKRYRMLVEHGSDVVSLLDAGLKIRYMSESARRVLGVEPEEVVGRSVFDFVRPERAEVTRRSLESAMAQPGVAVRHEQEVRGPNGEWRWIEVTNVSFLDDARIAGIMSTIRDVTDRKRYQTELERSAKHLQQVLDSMFVFVGVTTPDGVLTEVNRAALEMAHLPLAEVVGKPLWETFSLSYSPEVQSELCDAVERARRGELVRYDTRVRVGPDQFVDIDLTIGAIRDAEGRITHLVPSAVAITERKQMERELLRSREQLRALAAAVDRAREAERAHIAREIHDELSQALTGLKMDVAWLARRLGGDAAVVRRLEATNRLIDSTVETTRCIAAELRPGVLDDLGLAAAVRWQVREFADRTGLDCSVSIATDNILPVGDPRAITVFRVLQEALTNVARHAEASRVEVNLAASEQEVVLAVADNGRGVETRARSRSGFGIVGMRERARAWKGRVEIESAPGKGTVVRLRLPLGDGEVET